MADPSAGHLEHDPELIVGLLDRDVADADRVAANALIDACGACSALHEDLVLLARATAAAPTPVRTRDFILSPDVAASLRSQAPGEPVPAAARLSREMPDPRSRHDAHDRLLIANLVDRAVDEAERARAEELLAACHECEQLYDDLVALSAATRAMTVPPRPRDFLLTAADADRLRVRGWRRLLGAIGSSRDAFSRPVALGLTTLGIAGLMVATIPSVFVGGAASGPTLTTAGEAVGDSAAGAAPPEAVQLAPEAPAASAESGSIAAAAPSSAPSAAPEALPMPSDGTDTERLDEGEQLFVGSETSPLPGEPEGRDLYASDLSNEGPISRSTTIVVAGLLLALGLLLFGLRWTARRLGDS